MEDQGIDPCTSRMLSARSVMEGEGVPWGCLCHPLERRNGVCSVRSFHL